MRASSHHGEPLQMGQLGRMLATVGCSDRNVCIAAWRATFAIEHPNSRARRMLEATPDALLKPLLLSIGRLSERKGLQEFVTSCLPRIVASKPDAMLLIVGDAPGQALHARAQTPASIQSAADAADVGSNIKFLGVIRDYGELGKIYCAADIHVFPVRSLPGDPEGFGMVAVEAAAHGLPTVAFATGGIVDAVAEGQSGHLVAPGDYVALADVVLDILDATKRPHACEAYAQGFAWPASGAQGMAELSPESQSTHQAGHRQ